LAVVAFFFDVFVLGAAVTIWTSWRVVGRWLRCPAGRPGPGRVGFGAAAGQAVFVRRCRKSLRTRAGVSRSGAAGFSQGRRRSAASGRARRSWVWAARMSQVHRSAAAGLRTFGQVQPRVCLSMRKVCSMSKRRRNACHSRSTSAGLVVSVAWTPDHQSHTGFGVAPDGSALASAARSYQFAASVRQNGCPAGEISTRHVSPGWGSASVAPRPRAWSSVAGMSSQARSR
jgi:hypothetical protein